MSFKNVRVGDRVWMGDWKWHRGGTFSANRLKHGIVDRVTAAQFYVQGSPVRYRKDSGKPVHGAIALYVLSLATPEEIATWEAEQAAKKAEREAQEAARQQEQEEKNVRANRLADALARLEFSNFGNVIADGAVVTFEYGERRYRIEEIAD